MRDIAEIKADIEIMEEHNRTGRAVKSICGEYGFRILDRLLLSFKMILGIIKNIPLDRLERICDAEKDGICVVLPTEWLETLKLLTVATICYQEWHDKITHEMKNSKDIADLFFQLPTVQYTHYCIKLSRLAKSGIDVNKITSIDEIVNIFYPQSEKALEGLK